MHEYVRPRRCFGEDVRADRRVIRRKGCCGRGFSPRRVRESVFECGRRAFGRPEVPDPGGGVAHHTRSSVVSPVILRGCEIPSVRVLLFVVRSAVPGFLPPFVPCSPRWIRSRPRTPPAQSPPAAAGPTRPGALGGSVAQGCGPCPRPPGRAPRIRGDGTGGGRRRPPPGRPGPEVRPDRTEKAFLCLFRFISVINEKTVRNGSWSPFVPPRPARRPWPSSATHRIVAGVCGTAGTHILFCTKVGRYSAMK